VEAEVRVDELANLLSTTTTQDIQKAVYELCDWLAELADAHNKLADTFSRQEATKADSDGERKVARQFSQLKNRIKLLKAELLIKQGRHPEALVPLVEVVTAEPTSKTGKSAYLRLQEIGFSVPAASSVPASLPAEPALQAGQGREPVSSPVVPAGQPTVPAASSTNTIAKPNGASPSQGSTSTAAPVAAPQAKLNVYPSANKIPARGAPRSSALHPTVWIKGSPAGGPD